MGCGACCIAPSISSALPGLPLGKPAGERCPHLDVSFKCALWGDPRRPKVCDTFKAEFALCGATRDEALTRLTLLEQTSQ